MSKKVLLVDDDQTIHSVLKPIIESKGFTLISAYNGEEGFNMANEQEPSIIFLDIILPKMKGREVCERLKAQESTKDIPIIFLTAKDSMDDVQAALELGAAAHLTKPVITDELIAEIENYLSDHSG